MNNIIMNNDLFIKYHKVGILDFQKYIKSIGFTTIDNMIFVMDYYSITVGSIYWMMYNSKYGEDNKIYNYDLNDLTPLIKFERSNKLKKLLK